MWQQLHGRQQVDEAQSFPRGNSNTESLGMHWSTECYMCVKTSPAPTTFLMIIRSSSTMEKKLESQAFLANI